VEKSNESKSISSEKSVEGILYEQLLQLGSLSKAELVKNNPELVVKISLAMVEIARACNL